MTEIQIRTDVPDEAADIISAAIEGALKKQNREGGVSVTVVDDETIHGINKEYRNVDRPTDVISFPSEEGEEIIAPPDDVISFPSEEGEEIIAPPDGFLGDLVISYPRAVAQAEEYGHSVRRELSFLAVHGTLHLLGYDHMTDEDSKNMFALQDEILDYIGVER